MCNIVVNYRSGLSLCYKTFQFYYLLEYNLMFKTQSEAVLKNPLWIITILIYFKSLRQFPDPLALAAQYYNSSLKAKVITVWWHFQSQLLISSQPNSDARYITCIHETVKEYGIKWLHSMHKSILEDTGFLYLKQKSYLLHSSNTYLHWHFWCKLLGRELNDQWNSQYLHYLMTTDNTKTKAPKHNEVQSVDRQTTTTFPFFLNLKQIK